MKNVFLTVTALITFTLTSHADSLTPVCTGDTIAPEFRGTYVVNSEDGSVREFILTENLIQFESEGNIYLINAWTCLSNGFQVFVAYFGTLTDSEEKYESSLLSQSGSVLLDLGEIYEAPTVESVAKIVKEGRGVEAYTRK